MQAASQLTSSLNTEWEANKTGRHIPVWGVVPYRDKRVHKHKGDELFRFGGVSPEMQSTKVDLFYTTETRTTTANSINFHFFLATAKPSDGKQGGWNFLYLCWIPGRATRQETMTSRLLKWPSVHGSKAKIEWRRNKTKPIELLF